MYAVFKKHKVHWTKCLTYLEYICTSSLGLMFLSIQSYMVKYTEFSIQSSVYRVIWSSIQSSVYRVQYTELYGQVYRVQYTLKIVPLEFTVFY